MLTRSRSLHSVHSSYDKPVRRDAETLSRTVSVSELVERYQASTEDDSKADTNAKASAAVQKKTAATPPKNGPQQRKTPQQDHRKSREDKRGCSLPETNLSRSKSTGSFQKDAKVSIEALKAQFEMRNKPADETSKNVKAVSNREISKSAKEQKAHPAPLRPGKSDAKERIATRKVATQTLTKKDKNNIEKTAVFKTNVKRKSVADFKENSSAQEKEKLYVSVKALSALFDSQSKVATQEAIQEVKQKPVKQVKMAEDTQVKREDHLQPGLETLSQQFFPSQMSKQNLHQQRQKCELRRLLKHTHPKLKMLDELVDEELAEVLSSETEVTVDKTVYEGEVHSIRLIFENYSQSGQVSPSAPKMYTTEELVKQGNVGEILKLDQTMASNSNPSGGGNVKTIDVQGTRRIFESPYRDTSQSCPEKVQQDIVSSAVSTDFVQERGRETCDQQNIQYQDRPSPMNWTEQPKGSCDPGHSTWKDDDDFSSLEHKDNIKTRESLMQNNPFLAKNIRHSYAHMAKHKLITEEDNVAKVKNRTHLFESMPFDKIRHQNKDEVETMVETLKDTLSSLHRLDVIYADGLIIEVNETMRAKKAKYTKSASGVQIDYNEVSEGNFQNFILRVLPRANLKPQITYLTEDCNGGIRSTLVKVPVHPNQFTATQDTECNTANVVQVLEDILNQDNSLRRGVIIQEIAGKSADIVVYSLHKYSDDKNVRRYCPQELPVERKSPLNSPDSFCQGSDNPEVRIKGNVKLFMSCIEKDELEYLKTLQEKSTVEDQKSDIVPEEKLYHGEEWVPVDVKRLRTIFSEDQTQNQSNPIVNKDHPRSNMSESCARQNVTQKNDIQTERHDESQVQEESLDQLQKQCGDQVVQSDNEETGLRIQSVPGTKQETKCSNQIVSKETHTAVGSKNKNMTEELPVQHFQAAVDSPASAQTQHEEEEIVFHGKLKAALESLERSNINVSKGDFKAAMIYRNSSKPPKERVKNTAQVFHGEAINQDLCVTASQTQVSPNTVIEAQTSTANKTSAPQKNPRPVGPKPAIPPKPQHLKQQNKQSANIENSSTEIDRLKINPSTESGHDVGTQKPQEILENHQIHESHSAVEKCDKNYQGGEKNEIEEAHINFKEACKKFGDPNDHPKKRTPVKPKRVKIAQPDNKISAHVELRAKKGRPETDHERRQRLSVHMEKIMRGNMGTAMEIFDNLRKEEELRGILSRVEKIQEDTNEVDVRSLRKVFENVPSRVVPTNKNKRKQEKPERKEETRTLATETKSSLANVFGDLERASEDIVTLKEQTLARLVDIEEAIKKSLYSVSTLRSDSDIAGLSCLFKESLGSVQGSPASGNKISKTESVQEK
ncbi:LIM domain-containing protein isoform X1 [Syngnathus typhle]|uniref:LIM domain-containing protein isoform X1 n=2 Tax=Syngnathus typhle TaxID=161592 RepID=UPI002A69FD4A|nr:LIM domain-containing protein isoform X1 [Syngnathus typhle]